MQLVEEKVEMPQLQAVEKIGVIPDDPCIKVKGLITDLINRVQSEIGVMKFGASADEKQFARVKSCDHGLNHMVASGEFARS